MSLRRSLSRLESIDWDFAGDYSESPFSPIHWYPGRFASQIPATIVGLLSSRGDLVLDPFMGSGTTIAEAQRLRRSALGIDINPVACLAVRAKTLNEPYESIRAHISDIQNDSRRTVLSSAQCKNEHLREVPQRVQNAKWYTKEVFHRLRILWTLIGYYHGSRRLLAEAAFSAILLPVCRETRHWGYVCDNCAPQSDHSGDVLHQFVDILERFAYAYERRDEAVMAAFGLDEKVSTVDVHCGDAATLLSTVAAHSVDLVMTSPPYFGVTDYTKTQRLSMEWFDHDIEPLRQQEIGARSKRHRRTATAEYIADLRAVFTEVHRILKSSSAFVLVVGESTARPQVLSDLKQALAECGFAEQIDAVRRVSKQRRQIPSVASEHVLFYVKA